MILMEEVKVKKKVLFGIVIVLMLWGEAVFGGTLSVPSGYDTIQAAIDAAADGDVVTLADGTYTGEGNRNIDFGGKAITVQSENGPEACIIDCEDRGRGFYFHQGEGALSVLRGVTITNGVGFTSLNGFAPPHGGGGICCSGASPVIENCIITKNGTLIDSLYALGKGGASIFQMPRPASPGAGLTGIMPILAVESTVVRIRRQPYPTARSARIG